MNRFLSIGNSVWTCILIIGFGCFMEVVTAQQPWSIPINGVGTFSSPRVTDLNMDGTDDIILGAGREEFLACDSAVMAINGKNGKMLWHVSATDQIFGSAIFQDINGDGIKDVFIGGRSAELMAIDGSKGKVLWRFLKSNKLKANGESRWFNFYNGQWIPDQDNDGFEDLLVSNGGDVMKEPYDTNRPPGYLVVISAKTGKLLARAEMPDGQETYLSPALLPGENPLNPGIVFGTGGETVGGGLYVTDLKAVMNEGLHGAVLLDKSEQKGYIGPPAIVDLNQDEHPDIVTNSVNGRLLAFDGRTYQRIWEVEMPNTESYSSVALGYFNNDDTPDVFVSYGTGVWPELDWSVQMMVNGATGTIEYRDSLGYYQNTTAVVADFNGDGRDEVLMSLNMQEMDEYYRKFFYTTMIVIEFKSGETVQISQKLNGSNLSSTPWIGDLDNNGYLDFLYCHGTNLRHTYTFDGIQIHRFVTQIPIYNPIVWGAYQGSYYDGVFRSEKKAKTYSKKTRE